MFGRKKDAEKAQSPLATPTEGRADAPRTSGKGAPTPKRSVQQAARRRPLVPDDRKAAREQSRQALREERLRTRHALEVDDERGLPLRDKGPQRRFIRQYVDARWNLGEFLMIAAMVFVLLSFINSLAVQSYIMIAFWALMVAVILDSVLLRRKLKRAIDAKFGAPNSGDLWYGITRALQLRRLRLPKPQVKRGQYPA